MDRPASLSPACDGEASHRRALTSLGLIPYAREVNRRFDGRCRFSGRFDGVGVPKPVRDADREQSIDSQRF